MTKNSGTLIISSIKPYDSADTYPVTESTFIKGGHHSIDTLVNRDAIPAARREEGMTCYVAENEKTYILINGITNSDWVENAGSGSAIWGSITGTLSNQTDLSSALGGKEPTLTKGNISETTSSVLTITGGTNAIIGSGTTIEVKKADTSTNGYLSSTDWNTFNDKQNALGYTAENTTNKGAANGYAGLDSAGKVPIGQLPSAVMEYKGAWNPSTNTPTLADGTGDIGDIYRCSADGTIDLGSGSTIFYTGDFVIYNGTIWQRSPAADGVISVNGYTGAVTLAKSDVGLGNVPNTDCTTTSNITDSSNKRFVTDAQLSGLDDLLYVTPTASMSGGSTNEIGSTVTDVALSWTCNKTMVSRLLSAPVPTEDRDRGAGQNGSYTHTGANLTANTTYTITVNDGTNNTNGSTSVSFLNRRYYGVSASSTLDNTAILALSKEFCTGRSNTHAYDCTGGRYIYICYPASFGTATFTVGGLEVTFNLTTQSVTNDSGHSESFNVYRSSELQNGSAITVVVA